jgi:hypothetical protein
MMRRLLSAVALVAAIAACGGSGTDTGPLRYNFGVVAGKNQISTAGAATLGAPITTELTRDKNGTFARGPFDFLLPNAAFAQALTMPGTPVAGALICAQQSAAGEPQAVPLCAFTLADGTAPIAIKGGTKAGTFVMAFTAQLQTQMPVKDSTTVTVNAAQASYSTLDHGTSYPTRAAPGVFPADILVDSYGNVVPFRIVVDSAPTGLKPLVTGQSTVGFAAPRAFAHAMGDTIGTIAARTIVVDSAGPILQKGSDPAIILGTIQLVTAQGVVGRGSIQARVSLNADGTRSSATVGIGPVAGFGTTIKVP